jgi:hypothetical protein
MTLLYALTMLDNLVFDFFAISQNVQYRTTTLGRWAYKDAKPLFWYRALQTLAVSTLMPRSSEMAIPDRP